MKAKTMFYCTECGNELPKWAGQCPACKAWNTIVEQPAESKRKSPSAAAAVGERRGIARPRRMDEVETTRELRFATGMSELDRVLGGGAVQGSLVLLGGFVLCTALDFLLRPSQALLLLGGSLLGGVGMLAVLGLCRLISRGGVGMGDVKLLSAMGFLLGLYGSICVLLYAQLAALVCAVILLVSRKATWKDTLPFAPFFTAGFLLCLILGTY